MDDVGSIRSTGSSFYLDEEDRRYLDALRDRDHVATKNTRHPLGLFSVVAFILQQVIGKALFIFCTKFTELDFKAREYFGHLGLLYKPQEVWE